ncbi:hypothetical protein CRE03_30775 [Escherichia coli]|nr:hypothetical protein CRE03_30775 [Escherichia coli]
MAAVVAEPDRRVICLQCDDVFTAPTLISPYETDLNPPFTPDHAARTGTAVACVSSDGKEHILCTQNPFSLLMATDV